MKEINHNRFADSILKKIEKDQSSRIPLSGTIELTRLCTLKCSHCYIGDGRWEKDSLELNLISWKLIIDSLVQNGTLWLTFTGGEPTIHPYFRELWKYSAQNGLLLILYTNATLLNESLIEFFREYPPQKIEVSIYGATEDTYEKLTQVKGAYGRFINGIQLLRNEKFYWYLKAPITKETNHELDAMRQLAKNWNVEIQATANINASIGEGISAGNAPCSTRISPEELWQIEKNDPGHQTDIKTQISCSGKISEKIFECGAGKNSFYINARGKLQMCVLTEHRAHSLKEENFKTIWDKFGEYRNIKRSPASPCHNCDLAMMCENCAGSSFLETGSEQEATEWLCRQTHLKAYFLNIPHKCNIKHYIYKAKE